MNHLTKKKITQISRHYIIFEQIEKIDQFASILLLQKYDHYIIKIQQIRGILQYYWK